MKRILAVTSLLLFGSAASAQTLDDLTNDGKNTDNVLTYGMGYNQNRFSGLKEINKATIKRLVPVWNSQPRQRMGRAGAAAGPQWRHVCDQRQGHRGD